MSSDLQEIFRQLSFLSSVMAGFAIAVAVELIFSARDKPLATAAIAVFILSSVMSAASTTIFVFTMVSAMGSAGWNKPSEEWLVYFTGGMGVLPMAGLLLFFAGIGLIGWLRSKLLGMISTSAAILAILLVIYILSSMNG